VDRTFGPWFWGNLTSNSGNWLFNVTAAIVVFRLTGSALFVGLVSVAQYLPLVLFAPMAGSWSDRVDRRRLLFAGQAFCAACASILAILLITVGVDGLAGPWPIILTALGIGLGQAVANPALNSLVPFLVTDENLADGVALTSMTFNVGRALGPAAAGLLLATLGPEAAFVINAASFLPLLAALLIIQPRSTERRADVDRSVRAGVRYVRANRDIVLMLLGVGATGFAADPSITLTPPLAATLGSGDTLVAAMVSGFGIAAAITATLVGRLQRRFGAIPVARTGMLIMAAGLVIAALAPLPGVAIAGFCANGSGFVLSLTGFTTALQRRLPDELRGRVMALWTVFFLGNRPIAAAVDGGAADLVGPRWAMTITIAVALLGAVGAVRLHRMADGAAPGH
jgi:MFS family permease